MTYFSVKPTPSHLQIDSEMSLLEMAFTRGQRDFKHGTKVDMTFSPIQQQDIKRRLYALRTGNEKQAEMIAMKLWQQGVHLTDHYLKEEHKFPFQTTGEYAIEATNPYPNGSLLSKEWQRGFNSAYFKNLERKPKYKKQSLAA